MTNLQRELDKLNLRCDAPQVLQDKDGVTTARVTCDGASYVLKCFEKDEYRREIDNYRLLQSLQIPTMQVIASTDAALLLEDIDRSPVWRLGVEGDMDDLRVAEALAVWYRRLHEAGRAYVAAHGAGMYDEADYFTRENLALVRKKTGTQNAAVWTVLERDFDAIHHKLQATHRTLTYNDFYYTNLIVARNRSAAMMFDYNMLGKGIAYTDLHNVTWSLSDRAGEAFLSAYGGFDPQEAALDAVVSHMVTLYMACQRESFPSWARESLQTIQTPPFLQRIEALL